MQSDQRFRESFPGRVHQDWGGQRNRGGRGDVGEARGPVGRLRGRLWCREGVALGQNMGLAGKGKGEGERGKHQRQRQGEGGRCP